MSISENKVVTMHYSVAANGNTLDSSHDGEPLAFIVGKGFLVPGLESALLGKAAGDVLEVEVKADEAYGQRHDSLVQEVPKNMFEGMEVQTGMQFRATTDDGEQTVIVVDVSEESVTVDGNHPLAGVDLTFDVEILEVRDATEKELAHGQVHKGDCCGSDSCSHNH